MNVQHVRVGVLASLTLLACAIGPSPATASSGAAAVMAVDADAGVDGVQPSAIHSADADSIAVDIVVQTTGATGAFEFDLTFDPARVDLLSWEEGPFLGSTGRTTTCHQIIYERNARIGCTSSGAEQDGAAGGGVLATLHFTPTGPGPTCLVLILVETADVLGEPLPTSAQHACVSFSADSDGDGCLDLVESGSDPALGGGRSAYDFWDFYDVTGDKVIDLRDTMLILGHFGHGANDDALDHLLDRYAPDPARRYRSAEALGAGGIDLTDAMVNLASFGHRCR